MIKVKNISASTATLICTDLRFRRTLTPGREIPMSREIYDELSFDPGFETMIRNGILKVSVQNEENIEVIKADKTAISVEEIKEIFDTKDYSKFAQVIKDASPATKESVIAIAVEKRIVDNGFAGLINKYCNVDVLSAIANQAE